MGDDVQGELVVDEDGLHLPGDYAGVEDGFVVRTPSLTVEIPTLQPGLSVFPGVGPGHFGDDEVHPPNAHLAPDRVELKVYGEESTIWTVHIEAGED